MLHINRLFYQNDAHGFVDEVIRTFFPERGYLVSDIPRLRPGTELWVDFEICLTPDAKILPEQKHLRGYVRAKMLGYKSKNGSICLEYTSEHYGDGSRWILRTSKTPRVFELDELYEGSLNVLAERHPLALLPMLSH